MITAWQSHTWPLFLISVWLYLFKLLWHRGLSLLKRRVLERSLVGWRCVGGGLRSVIKGERGLQLPHWEPQESDQRAGAEAQPKEGAVMDRVGGEQIVSARLSNWSRGGQAVREFQLCHGKWLWPGLWLAADHKSPGTQPGVRRLGRHWDAKWLLYFIVKEEGGDFDCYPWMWVLALPGAESWVETWEWEGARKIHPSFQGT